MGFVRRRKHVGEKSMPRYNPRTGALDTYQPGPFDSEHLYLQWGGKLPGGEQWSCGLRMAGPAGTAQAAAVAGLAGAAAAVVAYHTAAATFISATALLEEVKLNAIGTSGHYTAPGTNQATYTDRAGGGPGAAPYPNQIAIAVSLLTANSRGPAHAGRIFLPLPGFVIDGTGLIATANAVGLATSTDTFIANLNAAVGAFKVSIFSRKAGAPAHNAVLSSKVGRVLDTQRRRRRSLVENYQV